MKTLRLVESKRYNSQGVTYEQGVDYQIEDPGVAAHLMAQLSVKDVPFFVEVETEQDPEPEVTKAAEPEKKTPAKGRTTIRKKASAKTTEKPADKPADNKDDGIVEV